MLEERNARIAELEAEIRQLKAVVAAVEYMVERAIEQMDSGEPLTCELADQWVEDARRVAGLKRSDA